jgi:hypothetical protein
VRKRLAERLGCGRRSRQFAAQFPARHTLALQASSAAQLGELRDLGASTSAGSLAASLESARKIVSSPLIRGYKMEVPDHQGWFSHWSFVPCRLLQSAMCAPADIARAVVEECRLAADANRRCASRRGNVVELAADNADDVMIVADLHGNRLNFEKLVQIADLAAQPRRHLIMQEVCHGGPQYPGEEGGCMSHLLLEDCVRLKNEFPERFHFLLSNHELAELGDFPICKSRRMLNLLFRCGINEMYGEAGPLVREAYLEFLATCPLAVRTSGGAFISHSCPDRCDQESFDVSVFERPLDTGDYKSGSPAFRLVWGRDFRPANADAFARQVGAKILIHGHEPCEAGFSAPNKRQIILDGCCSQATYLILPVASELSQGDIIALIQSLHVSPARRRASRNEVVIH